MNLTSAARAGAAASFLLAGLAAAAPASAAPAGLEPGYAAVRPVSSQGADAHASRALKAPVTEHVTNGRNVLCWEYGQFVRSYAFGAKAGSIWLRLYGATEEIDKWVPRAHVYYINDDRPPRC